MTSQTTIQRQYDEVVAPYYDHDPQSVTRSSQERALAQIREFLAIGDLPLRVLDLGMGTGMFLASLRALGGDQILPFGLDLSPKMIEAAKTKLPDLTPAVDDAANFDTHFPGHTFDLVCTHFITGYVPMRVLAPKIAGALEEGGYWSFTGATRQSYPGLQAKANSKIVRAFLGGPISIGDTVSVPADRQEVEETFKAHGFEVCAAQTYKPSLKFENLDRFLEFAYYGGWLTPFVEKLGLHKAGLLTRAMLRMFVFPIEDHHHVEIILARKL